MGFTFGRKYGKIQYICPWHSWIARQTPTLKVAGSNPVGQANTKRTAKAVLFGVGFLDVVS